MDVKWIELLAKAVHEPGQLSAAYSAFHDYSFGNQILAMMQCHERNLPLGPISTFPGWLKKKRFVKKGEKALVLCMPYSFKNKKEDVEGEETFKTIFVYKAHWFVLAQTDGQEMTFTPLPAWDKDKALKELDAHELPFDMINGNVQGYASQKGIAVSPLSPHPWKTWFHELAHVVMHQSGNYADNTELTQDIKEVEAECVALLVGSTLNLIENESTSRAYVQHWLKNGSKDNIPEKTAQRILSTADKILKAGQSKETINTVAD